MKINFQSIIATSLLFTSISLGVFGQEFTEIRPAKLTPLATLPGLQVGDQLPEALIPTLINYKGKAVHTSDFKEQLLLLDFWSVTCKGCVEAMPKMQALQKQFGNKIRILPVTIEEKGMVAAFWKSNPYTRKLELPSVVEDTVLSGYFRHRYLPHEAWVYKGKVVGITGADYVDAASIQKILDGEPMHWPVKNDYYTFDRKAPLYMRDAAQISPAAPLDYAVVSGYQKGINSDGLSGGFGIVRDPVGKTVRFYLINTALYSAFINLSLGSGTLQKAVKPGRIMTPNQLEWQVTDRNQYEYRGKNISGYQQDWVPLHSVCFESQHPDNGQTDQQVYAKAMNELNQLLGLQVGWQRRREKVYVLMKNSTAAAPKILQKGYAASALVHFFNQQEGHPYVFNEVGGEILLPEELKGVKTVTAIRQLILPYGLDLVEQQREVDKLVFAETAQLIPNAALLQEYQRRESMESGLKAVDSVENTRFLERNKKLAGVVTLPSGLQYKVIKRGSGPRPLEGAKVKVHYTGMQVNRKIFESTLSVGVPKILAISRVIPGWAEALQLMEEGSKWEVYIPASLAYGSRTGGGKFRPNSTLIFELELLQIIP